MKGNILEVISKKAGKAELVLKKKSPEILLGIGIVSFVGTVVTACKATLTADEVLEEHKIKMDNIHRAKEIADEPLEDGSPDMVLSYTENDYRRDIAIQYTKTAGNLVKRYAPTIALGALSLACILTSRNIMQKRYLGVVAAYNGLSEVFNTYRKRVVSEYGTNMDKHFRYGTTYDTLTETKVDENGKRTKVKHDVENTYSLDTPKDDTCRFFCKGISGWDPNPTFSMMFLRGQQNYLNDLFHKRGHLFLNEVYEALGFEHTPEGAVLGWIEGAGDDFIDFGLYDPSKESVKRFVNGVDNEILLEFNHDGVIWDKI